MENSILIQAPGRVNLLGEHTDYNGLPVLPMAIGRCIRIEGSALSEPVVAVSASDFGDEAVEFELQEAIPKHPSGHWVNYIKAGMQGVLDDGSFLDTSSVRGCKICVSGNIPPNAGLSSSSALVVASALALLQANGCRADGIRLAECLARAEHYVGTRGGGMDQAASLLGQEGHLLKIDFFPLRIEPVMLAEDVGIVICNSMVQAKKSAGALRAYNHRAVECRLGMAIVRRCLKERYDSQPVERLGDLLSAPWNWAYKDIQAFLKECLHESYTYAEVVRALEEEEFPLELLSDYGFDERDVGGMNFACGKRFRHIVGDGFRVERSVRALRDGDVMQFAKLVNEGHRSARDDFEISCDELERLAEAAKENGAMASRLTGAGFGGCTVNVVERGCMKRFADAMWAYFAAQRIDPAKAILLSHPGDGALRLSSLL